MRLSHAFGHKESEEGEGEPAHGAEDGDGNEERRAFDRSEVHRHESPEVVKEHEDEGQDLERKSI